MPINYPNREEEFFSIEPDEPQAEYIVNRKKTDGLNKSDLENAFELIDNIIQKKASEKVATTDVTTYKDPELELLLKEVEYLEDALSTLSNEKADIEKMISQFELRHNMELGELILKILQFRKLNTKNTPEEHEAEKDYDEFLNGYSKAKARSIKNLTKIEEAELKSIYWKAAKLCHPNKFQDENQIRMANAIFIQLKEAYDNNDINQIKRLIEELENGIVNIGLKKSVPKKETLHMVILKLKENIETLIKQLSKLKESETYKLITSIEEIDEYFKGKKNQLKQKLTEVSNGKE